MSTFLYTCQYQNLTHNTFWETLLKSLELDPTNQTILVPTGELKLHLTTEIALKLNTPHLPTILTLDEALYQAIGKLQFPTNKWDTWITKLNLENQTLPLYDSIKLKPGFIKEWIKLTTRLPQEEIDINTLPESDQTDRYFKTLCALTQNLYHIKEKLNIPDKYTQYKFEQENNYQNIKNTFKDHYLSVIGFWKISPYQKHLLEAIITASHTTSILLPYQPANTYYTPTEDLYNWLVKLPNTHHLDLESTEAQVPSISLIEPDSPLEEVIHCCTTIIQDQEQNPDHTLTDYAIVYPEGSMYKELLEEQLTLHNIPITPKAATPLNKTPLGGFIATLLTTIQTKQNLTHFINLTYSPFLTHFIQAPLLEELAKKDHIHTLNDLISALQSTLKNPSVRRSLGEVGNTNILSKCFNTPENLSQQLTATITLVNALQTCQKANSPATLVRALINLLITIELPEHLQNSNDPEHTQEKLLIKLINTLTSYIHISQKLPKPPKTTASMTADIRDLCNTIETSITAPLTQGLSLIPKQNSVMVAKKHTFILGLNDGIWPTRLPQTMLMQAHQEKYLNTPTLLEHYAQELFLLLANIHQSQTITLSTPKTQNQAPLAPSPHLTEIETYLRLTLSPQTSDQDPPQNYQPQSTTTTPPNDTLLPKLAELATQKNKPEYMTVTRLETYQKCPQHYFFKYILKEEGLQFIQDDIPANEWGTMLHEILRKFYIQVDQNQFSFKNTTHHPLLFKLIKTITQHEITAKHPKSSLWANRIIFLCGTDTNEGILDHYIQDQIESPPQFLPKHYEHAFKLHLGTPPNTLPLRGQIDAIVQDVENPNLIGLMEYKTGSTIASSADIKNLKSLQLPLYQLVLKQECSTQTYLISYITQLKDHQNIKTNLVTCTPYAKEADLIPKRKRPYIQDELFEQQLLSHAQNLYQLIQSGNFSTAPFSEIDHMIKDRPQFCRLCPYKYCCKFEKRFAYDKR